MRRQNYITDIFGKALPVLLATLLLLPAPGCGKVDPVQEQEQEQEIPNVPLVFHAAADNMETKAIHEAMTGSYDKRESFVTYAAFAEHSFDASDNTSYISFWDDGLTCSYTDTYNAWIPSTVAYWPMIGTLTFQAYSPAGAEADMNSGSNGLSHDWASGFAFTNFVVPAAGSQYDLMYSGRVENCRRTNYYIDRDPAYDDDDNLHGHPYNGIDLDFKHILSLIEVQAVSALSSSSSVKFYVKNVVLHNAYDKASFTQSGGDWDHYDTTRDADYTILGDEWKELPGTNDSPTLFPVNPDLNLILMPQVLDHDGVAGFDPDNDVYISLEYKKKVGDDFITYPSVTFPLTGSGLGNQYWEQSKKYTYRFTFSDYIEFHATISSWGATTYGNYVIIQ